MFQILIVDDDKNLKRRSRSSSRIPATGPFPPVPPGRRSIPWKNAASTSWCWRQPFPAWMVSALTKLLRDCKNDLPILMPFLQKAARPTLRRASSPAWMIMSRNPSIPRNLPFGSKPFSAGQRSSPSTSWSSEKPPWTTTPSPSPPTAREQILPPEGILPALQAPILPQPGIYPPAAHG